MLAEALIALEAGNHTAVATALKKALAWVEHDWLATPGEIRVVADGPTIADDDEDE